MAIDILTLAAARAGKGSGGSVSKYAQPEWGHEVSTGMIDVLPEMIFDYSGEALVELFDTPFPEPLVVGKTYRVTWNGQTVDCVAYEVTGEDGYIGLGRDSFDEGEEPFSIQVFNEVRYGKYYWKAEGHDDIYPVTVHIATEGEVRAVHKIPGEYVGGVGKYKQPEWGADTAIVDILPETELTVMEEVGAALVMQEVTLTEGNVYTVNFNGTEYNCTAVYGDNLAGVSLGNVGAMMEGMPATDDPFIFMAIPEENRENFAGACAMAVPLDGSASFTLSIKGESGEIHKIPAEYAEHAPVEPFIIAATGTHPNINSGYKIDKTWNEIEQAIVSGRMVYFHYSLDMYTIANFDPDSKRVRFIRIDDNNTNETTLGIITFEVTDRGSSYGTVAIRTAYVLVSNPGNPAT